MHPIPWRLYLVTDRRQTGGRPLLEVLDEALAAGVTAVQLREKDLPTRSLLDLAQRVRALTHQYQASFLVNDRIDIALAVDADGVHLSANSFAVADARRVLGTDRLIGVSTHSLAEAEQASVQGADFVVFGPVYETPSKREFGQPLGLAALQECTHVLSIPVFGIGGVTSSRAQDVRRVGGYGVAVISGILSAQFVEASTRAFVRALAGP